MRKTTMKPVALLCTAAFLLATMNAQAGFVSDFVQESQGSVNVTQAGVVQGAQLNVVTGGGFVFKVPRKEFVPFSITPPSLKAGCGGIDVFLGAFSIPSKDEFLNFMRSVGTALPGLAFQLALQTMAPDLNEMVGRYTDLIRSYTNRYTDSCQAAQELFKRSGAEDFLQENLQKAANYLRSSGNASDQAEAVSQVRDNGAKVIDNTPTRTDSGGNVVEAAEINLTWALLSSGNWTAGSLASKELREVMMTLVGTTVFTKTGEKEDAVLAAQEIAGADLLPMLFGEEGESVTIPRLSCKEATKCLEVETVEMNDMNLVHRMQTAADNYLAAIRSRDASLVTDADIMLLGASSGVPLLRILNMASMTRYAGIASDLVHVYVQAAAYEVLAGAINAMASNIRRVLAGSSATGITARHEEHVKKLEARVKTLEESVHAREDKIMQAMQRSSALVTQLEHIERALTRQDATAMRSVLPTVMKRGNTP